MKYYLIISFLTFITINSFGQGCGLVSSTKNKTTGIETKGGIASSKDFYSLLIRKVMDPNDSLNCLLFLNAASRVMLPDSLLKSKGQFELLLKSGKIILINNADCVNDPLGLGNSIGFNVRTNETNFKQILNDPIAKIKVFGILQTEFSEKMQEQQQKIINCLFNK